MISKPSQGSLPLPCFIFLLVSFLINFFWHHLQNTSVTQIPKHFFYSAHSVSTKTGHGLTGKVFTCLVKLKICFPLHLCFNTSKILWMWDTTPTEEDETRCHLLSQFPFFLQCCFAFFPFPFEGLFLLMKNLKKAIGDPLELRLTSCLYFGPSVLHSMQNNSESELQASVMHSVIYYVPTPKRQYFCKQQVIHAKIWQCINKATLLQKDKNIKQCRHFIFPAEKH